MKKQKFYPRQVLQRIAGKETQSLSEAQFHALKFFMLRSRRYGLTIALLQEGIEATLANLSSVEFSASSLPTRVFVGKPIRIASLQL